ncbi:hypothetical protein HaLaN_24573, partial [Haematococcus lacustris]
GMGKTAGWHRSQHCWADPPAVPCQHLTMRRGCWWGPPRCSLPPVRGVGGLPAGGGGVRACRHRPWRSHCCHDASQDSAVQGCADGQPGGAVQA